MKRLRSFGPELLILLGGLAFVILGRGRWANLTEDHGFWFSAVQGLLSGGRAMHEVRLQYGPVSLWVLEAACRIFGTRTATIVVLQFVVGLAGIVGVQWLARPFLSPVERWLSAAITVPLIVWMVGPGNLLYPCAFAMSHGLLFAVLAILLQRFFVGRGLRGESIIAGALAGVTVLTKQEFGVSAFLGIFSVTIFSRALSKGKKAGAIAMASIGLAASYFGILLAARQGDAFLHLVRSNLLWPWVPVPTRWRQLFRRYLGLDDPAARCRELADSCLYIAAFGGTAWLVVHGFAVRSRRRILGAALIVVWVAWCWRWTEGSHFLPMTLVLPALLAACALAVFRSRLLPLPAGEAGPPQADRVKELRGGPHADALSPGEPIRDLGSFVALVLGALVLLQREGYRGSIEGYYSGMGYVLAIPVIVPLLWWLARGPQAGWRRHFTAAVVLFAIFGWFGIGRLRALERVWKDTVPFETDRGRLYVPSGKVPTVFSTAEFIRKYSEPKDPILVLSSTYALDFMLDRVNLAFFPYVVPGYLTPEGERELIARCRRTPPAVAVVFDHSLGLLRSGAYDSGFASSLFAWLRANLPIEEPLSFSRGQAGISFRRR